MRLSKSLVLSMFVEHEFITNKLLQQEFGVSMGTASTFLSRLVKNGMLEMISGGVNSYWYYLVDKELNGNTIIQRVIRSWQSQKHPNLKNIPESWGGTRRGGSGHLSAIKIFVKELVKLELIKE